MKFKTTKKAIMANYSTIICVGYCSLQHLLNCEEAAAYTVRAEGWGCDIYTFGGVAISTGYAPFGNIRPKYEIIKKYDDLASIICHDHTIDWTIRKRDLRELIDKFIAEVRA